MRQIASAKANWETTFSRMGAKGARVKKKKKKKRISL
jgi:hypothetical protein